MEFIKSNSHNLNFQWGKLEFKLFVHAGLWILQIIIMTVFKVVENYIQSLSVLVFEKLNNSMSVLVVVIHYSLKVL